MKREKLKHISLIIVLILSQCGSEILAQGPTSHWFIGGYTGLKFENHSPGLFSGFNLNSNAAVAAISDKEGNLMYYARPNLIMNREHDTLQGAVGLLGSFFSTQGALFVPNPTNASITYFIHGNSINDDTNLHYSVIRTSITNPNGFILPTEKNIPLNLLGLQATSKLTAVHHSNGRDVWLITRVFRSDSLAAFLVTEDGVSQNPVFSNSPAVDTSFAFRGQLKASPDGKLLAEAFLHTPSGIDPTNGFHQFNNTTGEVTNSEYYHDSVRTSYGVEFSANSRYAYFAQDPSSNSVNLSDTNLCRFDLSVIDSTSIANSKISVGDTGRNTRPLQIGIDKKIYSTDNGIFTSGRIEAVANASYPISSYLPNVFTNLPINTGGLPDFIQSFFRPAYFDYKSACFGDTTEFISQTVGEDSLKWNFGDPSSGAANFSIEKYPKHVYDQAGEYNVTLTVFSDGSADTFSRLIEIKPFIQGLNLSNDSVCYSSPITLNYNSNQSWTNHVWMDSLFQDTFLISDTGTYWFTIWNECDTLNDTLRVTNDPGIRLNINDTNICAPASFDVTPHLDSATSWLWNDGDSNSLFKQVQQDSGEITFWLEASNACGTVSDTATIMFIPQPELSWFDDSLLCDRDEPFVLQVSDARWEYVLQDPDLDTLDPWFISKSGNHILTVLNECDTIVKSAYLSPSQIIKKRIPESVELCKGEEVLIDAYWPSSIYQWSVNSIIDRGLVDSSVVIEFSEELQTVEVQIINSPCNLKLRTLINPAPSDSCERCVFYIPNVFSPNGDGINDLLRISNTCSYQDFSFSVYNRWGQLVHKSNQSIPVWDGSIIGEFAVESTYFIIVEYIDEGGQESSLRTVISLVR